jgi:hypothetical protein
MLNEFLHDDPAHHLLAFCLIWWIPLLLIPVAWWGTSRIWRHLKAPAKWALVIAFCSPVFLSAMQLKTDWYLAGYWAPLIVYPFAVVGYTCLISLLWSSFTRWFFRVVWATLLLPTAAAVYLSFSSWIMLLGMFAFPHNSDRLSPTVTWRTDWTSMSFTSDWVAYEIYTNPKWFPLLKHKALDDRCFTSEIVDGNPAFRISPDGKSVIVSCRQENGKLDEKSIRIQ